MPIVDHNTLSESPWRPNYRKFDITTPGDGTTSSCLSYSFVKTGAGAPLHFHKDEELIVILKGELQVKLGNETQRAKHNHTLVIPSNLPHAFTNLGPEEATILVFFPVSNPFDHTTYLEGVPPERHKNKS